jgi:hypothetical protein
MQPESPVASLTRTKRIAQVPPAPPIAIAIPSLHIQAEVGRVKETYEGKDHHGVLRPPETTYADLARAYWWVDKAAPGNPAAGTVYIYGHTCYSRDCPAVFNPLQHIRKHGALIELVTPKGHLLYRTFDRHTLTPHAYTVDAAIRRDESGWLELTTCKLRKVPAPQKKRVVVWAKLVKVVVTSKK